MIEGESDFSSYKILDKYRSSVSTSFAFSFDLLPPLDLRSDLLCDLADFLSFDKDFLPFYTELFIDFDLLLLTFLSYFSSLSSLSSYFSSYFITALALYLSSSTFEGFFMLSSSKFKFDFRVFCELCLLLDDFSLLFGGLSFLSSLTLFVRW